MVGFVAVDIFRLLTYFFICLRAHGRRAHNGSTGSAGS
jgi:hypothetical protein